MFSIRSTLYHGSRCRYALRHFASDGGFKSILSDSKVPRPFSDPSRTRQVTVDLDLEFKAAATPVIANVASVEVPPVKVIVEETLKKVEEEVQKKVEELPKQVLAEKKSPLDDLAEINRTLSSLDDKTKGSGSGSGSSGGDGGEEFNHSEEAEKRRLRMEKNTRIGGFVLLGGSIVGFIAFCVYNGRAKRDADGNVIEDKHSGSLLAPFYRIYDSFWEWRDFVVEPAREKLLPDPLQAPYLQPKYTLVIELKNVLVSPDWTYKTGYRFIKRPALDYFLDVVGYPNFEVVIYTSESAMTAIPVVDSIDPRQRIMFRLYRDCTKYANGHHIKDLSKLNRDLSKVIFIEFDAKSGQLNPDNMLRVPEWKGNMDDTSLVDLAELLKTIHLSDVEDVRPTLQYYSQFDDPAKEFRKRAIYLAEQEEQKKMQHDSEGSSMLKRYSGKLFGFRRHQST